MRPVMPLFLVSLMLAAAPSRAWAEPSDSSANDALVFVQSPTQARDVCLAVRPTARVSFEGDDAQVAELQRAHDARRKQAFKVLYRLRLPAQGFVFGAYDSREEKLPIDSRTPFRASYGAVTVSVPRATRLLLPLAAKEANAAVAARNARSATLELSFTLDDKAASACEGSSAADVYTLYGKAVSAVLFDGMGTVLARTETPLADDYRSLLGGYSGVPTVRWGEIQADDAMEPQRLLLHLKQGTDSMRRCYVSQLEDHPEVAGVVMLGVAVNESGGVDTVDFIADALGDPVLRQCVKDAVTGVRFDEKKGLFRVLVEFRLVTR